MTEGAKLFKEVKLVTRSLLLSAPKGLTVQNFVNDYRIHNGEEFPFRNLGYNSAIDLIKDLPDAVRIEWLPSVGDFLLKGIADDSTKHIENLVKKQRKSKSRYPHPPRFRSPRFQKSSISNNYSQPPRFQKLSNSDLSSNNESTSYGRKIDQSSLKQATHNHLAGLVPVKLRSQIRQLLACYEDGLLVSNFRIAFKKHFGTDFPLINLGFSSLENCLRHIPEIATLQYSENLLKVYPAKRNDSEARIRSVSTSAIMPERSAGMIDEQTRHEVNGIFNYKNLSPNHMDELDGFDSADKLTKCNRNKDNFVSRTRSNILDHTFTVKTGHNKLDETISSEFQHNVSKDNFISRIESNNSEGSFISRNEYNFTLRSEQDIQGDIAISVTDLSTDNGISETMKRNFQRVLELYSEGIWATDFLDKYTAITRQKLETSEMGYSSLIELVSALPDVFAIRRPDSRKDDWLLFDVNNPNIKESESILKDATSVSLNSSTCEEELEINEMLKKNVLSVLNNCNKDIALEEFEQIYRANFNMDLPWASLGFDSVEAFMVFLSGDIPLNLKNIDGKFYVALQSRHQMSSSMFVDLEADPLNIPSDCALSDCSFEKQALPDDLSKYIGIYVSSVEHPGQIWIQIRGETTTIALEVLMENLEKVYYGCESDNYKMPTTVVEVGQVCAVVWPGDENWHRAVITGIPSKEFAEVFYVDYGSRGSVKKSGLRLLKKDFLSLPAQAIKARLAHIQPAVGKHWSEKAKQVLLSLCIDRPLAALITNTEYEERLSVCLCDVLGAKDFHINDFLVREGYARASRDPYRINSNDDVRRLTLSPPANQTQQSDINKLALALANYQSLTGLVNIAAARLIAQLSGSGMNIHSLPQLLSSCTLATNSNKSMYTDEISSSAILNETDTTEEPREIFEEGDEFYEQLCQSAEQLKVSIKRISLIGKHIINIIDSNHKPFVSSGDIASLFGKSVCLEKLLTIKKILIPSVVLEKSTNEEIFQDLKRFEVKGIKNEKGITSIVLYPLQSVMEILDGLAHPSEILKKEIANIITEVNNSEDFWQDNNIVEDPYLTSKNINVERLSMQELLMMYENQCKRRNEIIQNMTDSVGLKEHHVEELRYIENNLIKVANRMKGIENTKGNDTNNGHQMLKEIEDLPKKNFFQQLLVDHSIQNNPVCGERSISLEELHNSSKSEERNRISPQNIRNISPLTPGETSKGEKGENIFSQFHPQKSLLQYTPKNSECNNAVNNASTQISSVCIRDISTDRVKAIPEQEESCHSELVASKNIPVTQGNISPIVPSKPPIRFSSQIFAPRNCSTSSFFPVCPTPVQPVYIRNGSKPTS